MPDAHPAQPSSQPPNPEPPASPTFPAPEIPPGLKPRARPGRLLHPDQATPGTFSPEQRVMVLDCWRRSGLPAGDFAPLIGLSRHTLYTWKRLFDKHGPAGLVDLPRGAPPGTRVPELTRRAILLLKQANPDYGCERISDLLERGPALQASAGTVAKVLKEAGYVFEEIPLRTHEDYPRRFERPRPNQLWQTDLFTFILKRQNRRVYLVAFMDDHSRFMVSFGLHASQSTPLVMEVLRAAISCYRPPEEILTDNGSQYVTWRGRSEFARELESRGIRHIISAPRHPQTLCPLYAYVYFPVDFDHRQGSLCGFSSAA